METLLTNDVLLHTIHYGEQYSKEEWIEKFKIIGIEVPQHILDYDRDEVSKQVSKHLKYQRKNHSKINKKITCNCGGKYTKKNKSVHLNTKKHQKYIENNK